MTGPAFDAGRAQAHLEAIASQAAIELEWVKGPAQAYAEPGRDPIVYTPKPRTFWRYLVGLHELGHVCDADSRRLAYSNRKPDDIAREAYAWDWAFRHVLSSWKPLVERKHRARAGSYWSTFLP